MTTPVTLAGDAYLLFSDKINQDSLQRIFQNFSWATNPAKGIKHVHLLFQSSGGFVADGVCLYNFFLSCPFEFTIYNSGSVSSIAAIAFLGAKKRKASARASFVFHRSTIDRQGATATVLHSTAESTRLDDMRTESILRHHLKLPESMWDDLHSDKDLRFSAKEAKEFGVVHDIGEFTPGHGDQLFTI